MSKTGESFSIFVTCKKGEPKKNFDVINCHCFSQSIHPKQSNEFEADATVWYKNSVVDAVEHDELDILESMTVFGIFWLISSVKAATA